MGLLSAFSADSTGALRYFGVAFPHADCHSIQSIKLFSNPNGMYSYATWFPGRFQVSCGVIQRQLLRTSSTNGATRSPTAAELGLLLLLLVAGDGVAS